MPRMLLRRLAFLVCGRELGENIWRARTAELVLAVRVLLRVAENRCRLLGLVAS